ncbi:hypothetical protein HYU17_00770 [Candidatus Woesearchaeota archaeon]|nr:hypothetical protein [Candidatus Woesearchaeota archaeon]
MANERKIRCDCGGLMEAKHARFEGFETKAMVCPKCSFTTLTKEQAHQYVKLKQMHRIVDAERRIIRIGNSMGFTLPDGLKEFGIKVGKRIRIEALGPDSFKVVIQNAI